MMTSAPALKHGIFTTTMTALMCEKTQEHVSVCQSATPYNAMQPEQMRI